MGDNKSEKSAVAESEASTSAANGGEVVKKATKIRDPQIWRDLVAYWILGLCNNYGYVVMLSAAHDILDKSTGEETPEVEEGVRVCNYMSTGAILLADILPALFVKLTGPFLPFYVHVRVFLCCILAAAGFVLVAVAEHDAISILGVVCTSLSSGLGELTFLAYSSKYQKNVISTWSSGTGGAGIIGSLSYAVMIGAGLTPKTTLLLMLISPVLEATAFWGLLRHNNHIHFDETVCSRKVSGLDNPGATFESNNELSEKSGLEAEAEARADLECNPAATATELEPLTDMKSKLRYIPKLFKYMIPLTLVYLLEYFINQGLFELVYFPNIWLTQKEQYRWLQVDYQIGVFISRSSVNLIQFDKVWLMAVFQFVNVVFFLFEVVYTFSPSIWLVFAIVFWEGLLGGGAYVNTFYRMSKEIQDTNRKQYALSVVTMSDSVGIALAGALAIPSHNALCSLPIFRT